MSQAQANRWQRYFTPATVSEALDILREYDGQARVVGGGTDLLVETRRGLHKPVDAMVDVTHIEGLDTITADETHIVIGCGVTHSQIVRDERVRQYGTCLVESCGVIGGPQVRNVGTLAGNVAHALPAGDGTIGLLALGGEVEVASDEGSRWMPLQESFKGPGKSFIDRYRQILTRLRFPKTQAGEGSAHHRVMRPQGLCLPIISMGVRLRIDDNETIADARISMGPVGPVPHLAEPAMAVLVGGAPDSKQFARAADVALADVELRTSKYRASREYREQMVRTFLPEILERAAGRARQGRS
jgi:carbon-monoxide dehydrogenase medium subunit